MSHEVMLGKVYPLPVGSTANCPEAWENAARVRFRRARNAIGLTQEQVSHRLLCSVDAVQRWESGSRRIPAWALVALEALSEQTFRRAA